MSTQPVSPRHAAARAFASAGIPIFPCQVNGKRPATEHGFEDASADLAQVDRWWAEADYNIGLCPEDAGWSVVDLDGVMGIENWRVLLAENQPEPFTTYTVRTPRGGLHVYFQGSLASSVCKLADKIDTRGRGGYVLVPPSVVDGKPYTVEVDHDIGELPSWIETRLAEKYKSIASSIRELDRPGNVDRATRRLHDLVLRGDVAVAGSGGNNRTYQVACELHDMALSPEVGWDLLSTIFNPACRPPWDEEELHAILDHAYEYSQNELGAYGTDTGAEAFKRYIEQHADDLKSAEEEEADRANFYPKHLGDLYQVPPSRTVSALEYLKEDAPKPAPLPVVVDGLIEKGIYVPLRGIGGSNKSRLCLQLLVALLHKREWLRPTHKINLVYDRASEVRHVEYASFENDADETHRRLVDMKNTLKLSPEEMAPDMTFNIWELSSCRIPFVIVHEDDPPQITPFGFKFLRHLRAVNGHKVVILDGLFNACLFRGGTKNDDEKVGFLVELITHWCSYLDCTILAPFNPSRAGAERGDTGYSPVHTDRPREVLSITERKPKTKGETVPANRYYVAIDKWNNGRKRQIEVEYHEGCLLAVEETTPPETNSG